MPSAKPRCLTPSPLPSLLPPLASRSPCLAFAPPPASCLPLRPRTQSQKSPSIPIPFVETRSQSEAPKRPPARPLRPAPRLPGAISTNAEERKAKEEKRESEGGCGCGAAVAKERGGYNSQGRQDASMVVFPPSACACLPPCLPALPPARPPPLILPPSLHLFLSLCHSHCGLIATIQAIRHKRTHSLGHSTMGRICLSLASLPTDTACNGALAKTNTYPLDRGRPAA